MRTKQEYQNIPLEQFGEDSWHHVDTCRQLVGYQEDAEWECPYLLEGELFRAQFDRTEVGGLLCYPCLTKEAHKWVCAGLPIPVTIGAIGGISTS